MNKTIKNYKEAEKGCGKAIIRDFEPLRCGEKSYQKFKSEGEKQFCEDCKVTKRTSKQALQEIKYLLIDFENFNFNDYNEIKELEKKITQKRQKIQEALGEK